MRLIGIATGSRVLSHIMSDSGCVHVVIAWPSKPCTAMILVAMDK